jgi:hypothetical protein
LGSVSYSWGHVQLFYCQETSKLKYAKLWLYLVLCKGLSCWGENTDKGIADQCSENSNATCQEGTDIAENTV